MIREEALKLSDELSDKGWQPNRIISRQEASDMIRKLVAELDKPRELSDEEIIEIGNAVVNLIDSNEGWIEFAKAILKKASEK
jgi:hypothetical protein